MSRLEALGGDMEDLVEFSVLQMVVPASVPLLHQLRLSAFNTRHKCHRKRTEAIHVSPGQEDTHSWRPGTLSAA